MKKSLEKYNCPFCDVMLMKGQIIHVLPYWFVINNNKPLCDGHLLLIPRRHVRGLEDIGWMEWFFYKVGVLWCISFLKNKRKKDAFSFINAPSGQSVFHFHHHFVPNWFGPHGLDALLRKGRKKHLTKTR